MSEQNPSLLELNKHMMASFFPDTHAAPKSTSKGKKAAAVEPQFTADELAACAAVGLDPANMSADDLAALVKASTL